MDSQESEEIVAMLEAQVYRASPVPRAPLATRVSEVLPVRKEKMAHPELWESRDCRVSKVPSARTDLLGKKVIAV